MSSETEREPSSSRETAASAVRVRYFLAGGATFIGLMAWFSVWLPTSTGLEFPAPLAARGLPVVSHDPRTPATLPAHLVWRDRRIVSEQDGTELVYVPPPEDSSSDAAAQSKDGPAQIQARRGFFMDRHEVTIGQFKRFCIATGTEFPHQPEYDAKDMPVVNVSWGYADAYARWAGRRLPTEAEWTRAASYPDGRLYPWGSQDQVTWRNGPEDTDGHSGLAPVGSYTKGASALGLVDLSGNAWEWCSDVTVPPHSSENALSTRYHVLKGGSANWKDPGLLTNPAEAFSVNSADIHRGIGFRLVVDPHE